MMIADIMDMVKEKEKEEVAAAAAVAFEVRGAAAEENPRSAVPVRVRRRLLENFHHETSLEKIEAKLKDAHLRRTQFHEWLANKARPKARSPCSNGTAGNAELMRRLEDKLLAAERKRLQLLAQEKMRLAKLEELRQAAKSEVQLRAEREREELESKFETRVQQAESNRLALLEAERQRRAAAQERKTHSILQRSLMQGQDKQRLEALYESLCQRAAAAEEKRMILLEAEKTRAHAVVMQARSVANSVSLKREMEMRKRKEKLENRLQKARRKRAEYLKQRGRRGSGNVPSNHQKMIRHGDRLSRQLARLWRQFQVSQKTTYALAQDYNACEINEDIAKKLAFDQFASRLQSAKTLQAVKALLARIESRFLLSQGSHRHSVPQIDHLLNRLSTPRKKSAGTVPAKAQTPHVFKSPARYPERVLLCAYMILGHPDAVFSVKGERETALADAAASLVSEFESLVRFILDGPANVSLHSSPSSLNSSKCNWDSEASQITQRTFASQLAAFDGAWCSYLYHFLVWKVKDARLLEQDLIRMACQLEVSMLQKCKITSEDEEGDLSHDSKAIRKEVLEDQHLLKEKILHLSGGEGVARMEVALADSRTKFMESKENGENVSSSLYSPPQRLTHRPSKTYQAASGSKKVVRSLFKDTDASTSKGLSTKSNSTGNTSGTKLSEENVVMVNNILHDNDGSFAESICGLKVHADSVGTKMAGQVKSTMETAFWDGVEESLGHENPDYSWVVNLVKEVRDELLKMVPEDWKQDLTESIDVELFSQMLQSRSQDHVYLRKLFDYTLGIMLKLCSPASEKKLHSAHELLVLEITGINSGAESSDSKRSFAQALVKGLRCILEQLMNLKKEISAARIRILEPLVQGSSGVKYLQQAFVTCYGLPSEAQKGLPKTSQWFIAVQQSLHAQRNEIEASLTSGALDNSTSNTSGVPSINLLRTGIQRDVPASESVGLPHTMPGLAGGTVEAIDWDAFGTYVKLGMLDFVCQPDAAIKETVPETMELNIERLQNLQNHFQLMVVIATSMLLVRQASISLGMSSVEFDGVISDLKGKLDEILSNTDITIHEIVQVLSESCPWPGTSKDSNSEFITRMLKRSLSPDDPVFVKVSDGINAAIRAFLLFETSPPGRSMAEMALKRIGAAMLTEHAEKVASIIGNMVNVTCKVHGEWYSQLRSIL